MRFIALCLAMFATPAIAHDYSVGDISIKHPYGFPTQGRSGAGYMEIVNTGASDTLISAESEASRTELHTTVVTDGVAKMVRQDGVEIPADDSVMFAPKGLHVMFMGLDSGWAIGDEIPVTLTFETAGEVKVVFKVEERPAMTGQDDHSGDAHMDHSDHSGHAHD